MSSTNIQALKEKQGGRFGCSSQAVTCSRKAGHHLCFTLSSFGCKSDFWGSVYRFRIPLWINSSGGEGGGCSMEYAM